MSVSSISSSTSAMDLAALRKKMTENLAERMMKDLDKDGDGKVSKNELASASQAAASTQPTVDSQSVTSSSGASLDDLFTALDSDGDGAISKSELLAFMEKADETGESSGAPPMGAPPPGPPPGPPPDSASAASTEGTSTTEDSTDANNSNAATISEQQRMAMAYQMLMAALQHMGSAASESGGTSATA